MSRLSLTQSNSADTQIFSLFVFAPQSVSERKVEQFDIYVVLSWDLLDLLNCSHENGFHGEFSQISMSKYGGFEVEKILIFNHFMIIARSKLNFWYFSIQRICF